jgi:hypothetical protein
MNPNATPTAVKLDTSRSCFFVGANKGLFLKRLGMHAEVRLGGMEFFCGGPESLQLKDRKQIWEAAKLGPTI